MVLNRLLCEYRQQGERMAATLHSNIIKQKRNCSRRKRKTVSQISIKCTNHVSHQLIKPNRSYQKGLKNKKHFFVVVALHITIPFRAIVVNVVQSVFHFFFFNFLLFLSFCLLLFLNVFVLIFILSYFIELIVFKKSKILMRCHLMLQFLH